MAMVKEVISQSSLPLLETHVLLQYVLGVNRAWLIAHDTDVIAQEQINQYQLLQSRRVAGEPIAYLVGQKEFYGRMFKVSPEVLIPRPETELLVQSAIDFAASKPNPKILDLGTGSGAIAITIALERTDAQVYAVDKSVNALAVAQENAHRLGAKLKFYAGNWYDTGLGEKLSCNYFDLIVSNPPYVSAADTHLQQGDLRFEPVQALTDFADGLGAIRCIVKGAPKYLVVNGALFIEHGWDQASLVQQIFTENGFLKVQSKADLANIERITCGFL